MRSPKFRYIRKDLSDCVSPDTIAGAWKRSVQSQLRDQILIDLVEYRDLRLRLSDESKEICSEITAGTYQTLPTRHYLIEKSRGLCRQMTVAAPRDMLVLQCLSTRPYAQLKASQPTQNAYFEPGKGQFNKNHVLIRQSDYGSLASWKRFQVAIFSFSREREYIVVTDIANFYDFISFSHLRNIISSVCDVSESVVDFLIYMLDSLAWHPDYMPSTGVGMPQMESEAPRVLANAMLYELDRVANDLSFGDYARFMDDIDVGVDTLAEAKKVVRDIDLTLQARQLRLNSSKTRILKTRDGEAAHHFCIRENIFLDYASLYLERHGNAAHPSLQKALQKAYRLWKNGPRFQGSRFLEGNGEKIFKYLANLYHKVGLHIPQSDCLWLIQNVPGLREVCFSDLSMAYNPIVTVRRLLSLFETNFFVDDASYLYMSRFLVHARFDRTPTTTKLMREIVDLFLEGRRYFRVYAALIIASKFCTPIAILEIVRSIQPMWERDLWMGRVVGGLTPIVQREKEAALQFYQLGLTTQNREWESVYRYHDALRTDTKAVSQALDYCKHPNPSYPYGLFHPKALVILSVRQNRSAQKQFLSILAAHPALRDDPYYRGLLHV